MGDFGGSTHLFRARHRADRYARRLPPGAELRLPLGPSLFGALHAAVRETAYGLTQTAWKTASPARIRRPGSSICPSASSRELVELSGELGTQFGRVFDFPYFGLDKIKHTIEPTLDYRYIPPVDQSDLPVFDGIDRINKRSMFTYGVASPAARPQRLRAEDGERGEVIELMRLSATQSYDFLRDIPPVAQFDQTTGTPLEPGQGDHFSDIDFALRVNPSRVTSIRAFATYDASDSQISSTTVGIRLRQPERISARRSARA